MDAAPILLVLAAAGVNFGWQPVDSARDGYECIAPIEPELAAVRHTVYFAGQSGWAPDRYESPAPAAAPRYERYPVAPAGTASGVGPPPSVADRARTAVSETGTTLREGVEAGIQAANQQFTRGGGQVIDATRSAGQELGQQLQGWTDSWQVQSPGNNPPPASEQTLRGGASLQVSNPFAATSAVSAPPPAGSQSRNGVAPPPWAGSSAMTEPDWSTETAAAAAVDGITSPGTLPARTASGWTSISSSLAPPALLVPRLVNTTENMARPQSAAGDGGPGFPATSSGREPIASMSAEQTRQTTTGTAADSWAIGWGTESNASQATIGRIGADTSASLASTTSDRASGSVQTQASRPQDSQASAARDLWAENDPWADLPQTPQAGTAAQQNGGAAAAQLPGTANNPPPIGSAAIHSTASATVPGLVPPVAVAPAAANSSAHTPAAEKPPWMPLLLVSLSLAGSLGANLFLGWSYMDARQKYRTLVRKTADKFRRAAA